MRSVWEVHCLQHSKLPRRFLKTSYFLSLYTYQSRRSTYFQLGLKHTSSSFYIYVICCVAYENVITQTHTKHSKNIGRHIISIFCHAHGVEDGFLLDKNFEICLNRTKSYFCELKKLTKLQNSHVHVWKVAFKNGYCIIHLYT